MRLSVQIEFDKTLDLVTAKRRVVVGRSKDHCDLVIPKDSISRKHCIIEQENKEFYITDLGSSNGVTIKGQRIPPQSKRQLKKGEVFEIGTLECEISDFIPNVAPEKIVSSTVAETGDYTATIRISRIELNQPSVTLELEKKKAAMPKKARNPITAREEKTEVKSGGARKVVLFLLALAALAAAWYFGK